MIDPFSFVAGMVVSHVAFFLVAAVVYVYRWELAEAYLDRKTEWSFPMTVLEDFDGGGDE